MKKVASVRPSTSAEQVTMKQTYRLGDVLIGRFWCSAIMVSMGMFMGMFMEMFLGMFMGMFVVVRLTCRSCFCSHQRNERERRNREKQR